MYDGTHCVLSIGTMKNEYRQAFLKVCKTRLNVTWDEFATLCGLEPRAFKTYRMPEGSKNVRRVPGLVFDRVLDVMEAHGHNRDSMIKIAEDESVLPTSTHQSATHS